MVNPDFQALFEASPSPYLVVAPDAPRFTILAVNDAYMRATATEREAILGRGLFEVFPDNPDDPHAHATRNLRASLTRALERRAPDRMDVQKYDIPRAGGGFEERYWQPLNTPVLDGAGGVASIIHYVEDVTAAVRERRAASDDLLASEERFRQVVDSALDFAIVTTGPDGRVTTWNAGAERLLGFPEAEILGRDAAVFFTPEDREAGAPEQEMRMAREEGRAASERWHLCKDGSRFWSSGLLQPLADGRGFLKIFRDRTREHEAESQLRESEARLRAAILASPFPTMLHAEDGEILELSRKWTELTGYAREEIGTHFDWARLAYPDMLGRFEAEIAREFAAEGEVEAGEWEVRAKDGSIRIWDFYNVGLGRLPDGRRLQVSAAADVTDRKAAESELVQLNAELADKVAAAVAAREVALHQVHEMQKLETLGQLTGGIAHDFNNLLTPIVASLDIIQRRYKDDERASRLLSGALQSAERAGILVSRLLAFARRQLLDPRPVDLASLVVGMSDLIDRSLGPQIEVRIEVPQGLPAANVDPNQLELALLNLCVNARDAMPGGGQLTIAADTAGVGPDARAGLAPGRYVRLCVSDTGVGMTREVLSRAVEPFYTTKGTGRGTGLGLSMVHGLAAQSGGALRLTSQPDRGTTASIWLPAVEMPQQVGPSKGEPDEPISPCALSILLVDDEDLVRMGTADMLEGLGHGVVQTASGTAALQRLRSGEAFDLLLTDYLMPGMTGVELAARARELRPGLPAALITGFATLSDVEAAGLPRLAKPFRVVDLARLATEAVEGRNVVRMPRGHGPD